MTVRNVNGAELGSSCLALSRVGKSPRKEPQTPGAFCPKAWLCKKWGKGPESVELVHSWEPPLPAGVRMGAGGVDSRPGRLRNENGNSACSGPTDSSGSSLQGCELSGQPDSAMSCLDCILFPHTPEGPLDPQILLSTLRPKHAHFQTHCGLLF